MCYSPKHHKQRSKEAKKQARKQINNQTRKQTKKKQIDNQTNEQDISKQGNKPYISAKYDIFLASYPANCTIWETNGSVTYKQDGVSSISKSLRSIFISMPWGMSIE